MWCHTSVSHTSKHNSAVTIAAPGKDSASHVPSILHPCTQRTQPQKAAHTAPYRSWRLVRCAAALRARSLRVQPMVLAVVLAGTTVLAGGAGWYNEAWRVVAAAGTDPELPEAAVGADACWRART
jgi:hypothetical protein